MSVTATHVQSKAAMLDAETEISSASSERIAVITRCQLDTHIAEMLPDSPPTYLTLDDLGPAAYAPTQSVTLRQPVNRRIKNITDVSEIDTAATDYFAVATEQFLGEVLLQAAQITASSGRSRILVDDVELLTDFFELPTPESEA